MRKQALSRLVAPAAVVLTLLISGGAAGFLNGRWGSSHVLREAVARLDRVAVAPSADWDVQEQELSEREMVVAEVDGYIARRYVHRRTGVIVSILLVCGRPGPISVHTPEVCYMGAGYTPASAPQVYEVPAAEPCRFLVRDFQKRNAASPTRLRIFYAWGLEGRWLSPSTPRLTFAGKPSLYKLYVVRQMTSANEPVDQGPTAALLTELIPQFQKALFSSS
jgi:hypothetical protein